MQTGIKFIYAAVVALVVALAAPAASAYWGWGGPWYGSAVGYPYGGVRPYRSHLWHNSYQYDPAYRYAPAYVKADIRRYHRYRPGYWHGRRHGRPWW